MNGTASQSDPKTAPVPVCPVLYYRRTQYAGGFYCLFPGLTGSLKWSVSLPGHQLQCRDSQQLLYQPPLDLPDPEPVLRTGNAVVHRSKSLCAGSQRTVHVGVHHTDGLRDDPQQALHHCPDHGAGICAQPAAGFPQPRIVSKKQTARIQSRLFYYIIVCPLVKL